MRKLRTLSLVACTMSLIACTHWEKNERIYEKAHGVPQIVTPPGVAPPTQEAFYYVNAGREFPPTNVTIIPPGSRIMEYRTGKPNDKK